MSKNPLTNALAAEAYIVIIATVMQASSQYASGKNTGIFAPIAVLSVFTLSAAVMGYLFLGEPIQLFLSGKKKEAVTLFLQTVGIFAVLAVLAVFLNYLIVSSVFGA